MSYMPRNCCALSLLAVLLTVTGCVKHISVSCSQKSEAIDNKELANFGAIGAQKIGFINSNGAFSGNVYQLSLLTKKSSPILIGL